MICPLCYALSDLRKRMLEIGSEKSYRYVVGSVQKYFDGCVEEATNRLQGIVPELNTYIRIRSLSVAVELAIDLTEFCNHLMIPNFLRQHDTIQKLRQRTTNIIAWCNDIFSVFREMKNNDVHNLVAVLHYQKKISLEQAIHDAAKMHDQEVRYFMNLEISLPYFGEEVDTQVTKYISGMYSWIRGNYDWYFQSARYDTVEKLELVESLELVHF
jgi:5-epi-alpha-selinene synthase